MNILSTIKKIINGVDIDSLKSKIAELESNLRRIKDDNARKVTEIASLEKKNETLNEDLIREQNKVCIAENKQREFAIKLSELEKKTTSLESLNGTLLETQKSLSKDNISLKAKITRWDNKISSLQEEKDQLTGIITKLQEESSILTQKNEEFKKALEESENVNLNNVAEIGRLKTEIVLKNDELENEKAEKKSTSQKLYELNFLYSNLQKNTLEEKEILLNRISESVNRCKKLEEDNATLREP